MPLWIPAFPVLPERRTHSRQREITRFYTSPRSGPPAHTPIIPHPKWFVLLAQFPLFLKERYSQDAPPLGLIGSTPSLWRRDLVQSPKRLRLHPQPHCCGHWLSTSQFRIQRDGSYPIGPSRTPVRLCSTHPQSGMRSGRFKHWTGLVSLCFPPAVQLGL